MNYEEVKPHIKTGDLYFTNNTDIFSKIICLVTKSNVSHVGLFVWLANRLFIVEAKEFKGCRMMLASEYFKKNIITDIRRAEEAKVEEVSILEDVGVLKYDMLGALLSPFYDTKSESRYCSEFVVNKLNLNVLKNRDRGVYPSDLIKISTGIK